MPYMHAPGTPSFEAQLGTVGAIEHMAWLGERFGGADPGAPVRARLERGYAATLAHETTLAARFLTALPRIPKIRLFGPGDPARIAGRVPTFSLLIGRHAPARVADVFARRNIFVWNGSFYAYEVAGALGVRDSGGVVRIGFAHYNTVAEVDMIVSVMDELAATG